MENIKFLLINLIKFFIIIKLKYIIKFRIKIKEIIMKLKITNYTQNLIKINKIVRSDKY